MRHLTREKAQGWRLLDRAKTIAVVGAPTAPRHAATLAYLRRAGYDVRPLRAATLSRTGGAIDLVVVAGTVPDVPALLRDAAAKRADGVWFIGSAPDPAANALARELGLAIVRDSDIVARHGERLREAGQPPKIGVRPRSRGRPEATGGRRASRTGWTEAGGGGQRGGGGGRAALDEKKMTPRRRSRAPRHRAA
jgi:predicted CoA-binding protein